MARQVSGAILYNFASNYNRTGGDAKAVSRERARWGDDTDPHSYGTTVGYVEGSHTSLVVATNSFMLVQVRRPGILL